MDGWWVDGRMEVLAWIENLGLWMGCIYMVYGFKRYSGLKLGEVV